jgi:mono/diheme cytochrome c family protein
MTTPRISATLLRSLVVLPVAALLAVGCGGDSDSDSGGDDAADTPAAETDSGDAGDDAGEGKSLFTASCGGCHELSDAETTGSVGPTLDGAALDADTVKSKIAAGGGGMPAGLLEGEEADAVAEYVAGASGG